MNRLSGPPRRHGQRRLLAERLPRLAPRPDRARKRLAELLQSAALALLSPGTSSLMPWPSYPLYPLLAAHARATPVPVEDGTSPARSPTTRALSSATRTIRRAYSSSEEIGALLSALPEHVHLLLDEALIHFQDVEDVNACLRLVDAFPRLLVVRTVLEDLRAVGPARGYAVGLGRPAAGGGGARARAQRALQAAVEHALRHGDAEIERRRRAVVRERPLPHRPAARARRGRDRSHRQLPLDTIRDLSGDELANALRQQGVIVAPGGPLGEDHHIRAAVRDEQASKRLLRGVANLLGRLGLRLLCNLGGRRILRPRAGG